MKTIPLKTACDLLDKSIFLSLDSAGQDVQHSSWGVPDDEDDSFLFVCWQDDKLQDYAVEFRAKDNQNVEIDEKKMFLIAEDGEKETIGLVFDFANLADEISKLVPNPSIVYNKELVDEKVKKVIDAAGIYDSHEKSLD
jgi:hypothetical protein